MIDRFVKVASWHVVKTPTRAFNTYRTLCGLTVETLDIRPELDLSERSCETCLRLNAVSMAEIERAIEAERDEDPGTAPQNVPQGVLGEDDPDDDTVEVRTGPDDVLVQG